MARFGKKLSAGWGALPFALDLTNDAVTLYARADAEGPSAWHAIGEAHLGSPAFPDQIEALRVETIVRSRERLPILLWLPPEQIVSRVAILSADSHTPTALAEAAALVAAETDFAANEICVALSYARRDEPARVLGALVQTVEEAKTHAARWGFGESIVSARDDDRAFGPNGPVFRPQPSYTARAGHSIRRTAVAASAIVAVGVAAWGAYQIVAPLVEQAPDVRSSGPEVASFAVVLDPVYSALPPLKGVESGVAGALAIQPVFLPDDDAVRGFAAVRHTAPPIPTNLPKLAIPRLGAPMEVGGAPVAPERQRPGKLALLDDGGVQPDIAALRAAVDLIRAESSARQDSGQTRDGEGESAPAAAGDPDRLVALSSAGTRAPALSSVRTPSSQDGIPPAQLAAAGAGENEGSDEGSVAPTSIDAKPQPRPADLAPAAEPPGAQSDAPPETEGAASPEPSDQTADAVTDAAPEKAARPERPPRDADGGEPAAGNAGQAAAEEEPPSAYAALMAPKPPARPARIARAARERAARSAKSVAARIPRSATEDGALNLDSTMMIGVIESRRGRQALVRTANGDFRRVARGDLVDGWRVRSIDREAMRLTRRGKNRTLLLIGN